MDVLVLGLDHWIQRHQDNIAERNEVRRSFERGIRRLIEERRVQVVTEEAGNDDEVAEALQRDENAWAPLEGREPRWIEPVETIARTVTRALDGCFYADIRPPGDWPDSRTPEYEQAMLNAILLNTANTDSVLVLCGESHRGNISRALAANCRTVEDRDFDWVREK
jgi:hypothetical protein